MPVCTGLDVLIERLRSGDSDIPRGRVGLVTNHSAVTGDLVPGVDALRAAGLNVAALYGPEHGVRGDVAAGQLVESGADPRTGLPVHSLYGDTKKPTPAMLEGIDSLVFDMQDAGVRFYTFLSTLKMCVEAAGENGIPLWVLDRPNPLGGTVVEGAIVREGFTSFVGIDAIPIRYGMTIGETAEWFRSKSGGTTDLHVVVMRGWTRETRWEQTGLDWVMPSPNIPTADTVRVYPGMCFIEGTQMSEGRGTARPFEIFGAPWIDADDLAEELNALAVPGARWRPVHFIPNASKHKDVPCHGCQLHITNHAAFRPVAAGVRMLATVKRMYPDEFEWLPPFKEGRPPFIDLLGGGDELRTRIDAGKSDEDLLNRWAEEAEAFLAERTLRPEYA